MFKRAFSVQEENLLIKQVYNALKVKPLSSIELYGQFGTGKSKSVFKRTILNVMKKKKVIEPKFSKDSTHFKFCLCEYSEDALKSIEKPIFYSKVEEFEHFKDGFVRNGVQEYVTEKPAVIPGNGK